MASRRACELLISQGRVAVNGQVVTTLPAWADPATDRVEVDGKPIRIQQPDHHRRGVYVIVNKPRHVVTTTHDPHGRRCVMDLVDLPARLFPVGRLDAESTGLLLLTNDGDLANRLTHPSYEVPKQYQVSVRGRVTEEDLQTLKEGLYLAHQNRSAPAKTKGIQTKLASMAQVKLIGYSRDAAKGDRTNLAVTLREGQNREIRRLLARLGFKVRRLQRVAIGPISVKGLGPAHWRHLTPKELTELRKAAGPARLARHTDRPQPRRAHHKNR